VNHWIVQIRKVTVLPGTTPFPAGDATAAESHADLEEVAFWTGLEEALKYARVALATPPVVLTVVLLKAAKRFVATIALENNTGLDAAKAHVADVAGFLRTYPTAQLAAARGWPAIGEAVDACFAHLPKVRQSRRYDLDRLARLVEATTLTLRERMEGALREGHPGPAGLVLGLDYAGYARAVRGPTQDIFVAFDASFRTFGEFFLDQGRLCRKAGEARDATAAGLLRGIVRHHKVLRGRLEAVYGLRTQHERLRAVVADVLTGERDEGRPAATGEDGEESSSAWALREVDGAPAALFATVDVLDLGPRGEAAFAAALEGYDRKVDVIEEQLARLLRNKLSACQVSVVPSARGSRCW
jgi:dynein heavy chain 1